MESPSGLTDILQTLPSISLEEMSAVKLMNRTDTKYLLNEQMLAGLAQGWPGLFYVQENLNLRTAGYKTLYFDTPDAITYTIHHNQKLHRQKIRERIYVVESISRRAFRGCSNLETVTIGSGVKNIGYLAFDDCPKLSQIVCEAATPPTLETSVFSDNTLNYKTLVVPQGKKSAYENAAGWGSFKKIVEVGDEGYQFMNSGAKYQVINGTTSPYTCMQVYGNYTSNDV